MASRIFVKGLPPTFTEADFRKHFSQKGRHVTDVKIFPSRRIGYVGYKTPDEAQKAVKYFNKTFIRMSRIGVELARPVEEQSSKSDATPANNAAQHTDATTGSRSDLKRKRDSTSKDKEDAADPKLKEFLETYKPKSKKAAWENEDEQLKSTTGAEKDEIEPPEIMAGESDDEYEQVPKKAKRARRASKVDEPEDKVEPKVSLPQAAEFTTVEDEGPQEQQDVEQPAVSDADWARSRTSRLLGLLDDDEEDDAAAIPKQQREDDEDSDVDMHAEDTSNVQQTPSPAAAASSIPTPPGDELESKEESTNLNQDEGIRSSMRLFVRNLPFDVQPEELEAEFAPFGNLEEVHISTDKKTGTSKGFAFVQYSDPDSAEQALLERDGKQFQGRLIHIIAAKPRRQQLDEFELSKLPLKKQQDIKRRRELATKTFNWNALYMNTDAVVSSVASRLGLSKSEVLDPTSSDAAVKQAHAETHIIQETKSYFRKQGVDLDSFKKSQRGDTAILVKNIPFDCSKDELKRLFEEHGDITKFLMPPSGTIAIVAYANAAQCKAAFGALAYRRLKSSMLFLEKAPKDIFSANPVADEPTNLSDGVSKVSVADLKSSEQTVPDTAGSATLYVRNLNFSTTTQLLTETFKPLSGFLSARVKTKTDPKKPGQVLSMGFGFLEFRTAQEAQAALQAMDGYTLEGHKLQIRASHKGADAAEERRKADAEKKAAGQRTKIIIKNLPFEATKKDIRALFGAYGQLRSVRVPKKMDRGARGFAFADFMTVKEAQGAMDALRDTHLLGRRLVLDFAAEDPEDAEAEIEKMQQKVGAQVNKVALQKLTSGGRKKFTTQNDEEAG